MATFNLPDPTPTIPQTVLAMRAGKPAGLARTTREDVIEACRERGIEIRDGRLQLGSTTKISDLYFGVAYRLGILERPASCDEANPCGDGGCIDCTDTAL